MSPEVISFLKKKENSLFFSQFLRISERLFFPLFFFLGRLILGGSLGQESLYKMVHWQETINLFNYEYVIPFFSPEIGAYTITLMELSGAFCLLLNYKIRGVSILLLGLLVFLQFTNLASFHHGLQAIFLSLLFWKPFLSFQGFGLRS